MDQDQCQGEWRIWSLLVIFFLLFSLSSFRLIRIQTEPLEEFTQSELVWRRRTVQQMNKLGRKALAILKVIVAEVEQF